MRCLLVEDELLVAMLTEDFLGELGHDVVALASCVKDALASCSSSAIDFAVLDVNLGVENSFPVARCLEERNIPYIFVTGYGAAGVIDPYCSHPVLAKPFTASQLEAAIVCELERVRLLHPEVSV